MSKFIAFVKFCAFILGAVGGFGYAVYGGSWPIAAAIIILALMVIGFSCIMSNILRVSPFLKKWLFGRG